MSGYSNNSIFWVETEKIKPNPFQPRREFEQNALADLADSIRQYGVLQPLVVTRKEEYRNDGGMEVSYELIAGERRLRASKLAGLHQVPVIIRQETDEKVKLELAIIENLQREDLNPIDRALAFEQLYKEFNLTHAEIGKRMGKSRVYVSNTLRLLALPDDIKRALMDGKITEGHTRPLLMLVDRPEEQSTLFREIILKNMSVRDAEKIARKVAQDKVRKKEFEVDPKIQIYEKKMSENLGTRVQIEPKEQGGKIVIDYFTLKDLDTILELINKSGVKDAGRMMNEFMQQQIQPEEFTPEDDSQQEDDLSSTTAVSFENNYQVPEPVATQEATEAEPHVSDFLTGNPYKSQESTPVYQQPETIKQTAEEETVPSYNQEPEAVIPQEQAVQERASSYADRIAQSYTPQGQMKAPEPAIPASSPVSEENSYSYTPKTPVATTPSFENQDTGDVSSEAYPQGDPYLENPTVEQQSQPVGMQARQQYVPPQQSQYNQYQQQPLMGGYQQAQPQRYNQAPYQQVPEKKGFLKKLFG